MSSAQRTARCLNEESCQPPAELAAAPRGARARGSQAGVVLLEVVLALVLFVGAASIISSGLHASVDEVDRLRWNVHASNLAASVLSEMQMGLKPVESSGPNAFDPPFDAWTWQATVGPVPDAVGGLNTLQKVEIVVRHKTHPVVFRLTQFLPPPIPVSPGDGSQPSASGSSNESAASPYP